MPESLFDEPSPTERDFRYELGDAVRVKVDGFWCEGWVAVTARFGLGIETDDASYVEVHNRDLYHLLRFKGDHEDD